MQKIQYKLNHYYELPHVLFVCLIVGLGVFFGVKSITLMIATMVLTFLVQALIKRIESIEIDEKREHIVINHKNYFGFKGTIKYTLEGNSFTFKEENVSRMSKRKIFRLKSKGKTILKLTSSEQGLDDYTLSEFVKQVEPYLNLDS